MNFISVIAIVTFTSIRKYNLNRKAMMRFSLFLLTVLVGLSLAEGTEKSGDKSTQSVTYPHEGQLLTPLPLPSTDPRKGEIHFGRAAIIGRNEYVVGKHHAVAHVNRAKKTSYRTQTAGASTAESCGNVTCDHREICIYHRKTLKPVCVRKRVFKASKRRGRGHNSEVSKSHSKLDMSRNQKKLDLHRKVDKLKLHANEFKEQHDQKFKLLTTTDRVLKLRGKKFVGDNSPENNTPDKSNKECRQKELDVVGRHLLDQFKLNQDEDAERQKTINKRRKEKRNSTKKELHEDDECICQAPVTWQFQQVDADTDGQLNKNELKNLTSQGSCTSWFIRSCDHDNDANLSEKEWCCCFADILPPCLASLKSVPSILVRGQPIIVAGAFVPQCDDDGFYSKVQCHASTGQCWCVDRNGKQITNMTTAATPDCGMSQVQSKLKEF